MKRIPNAQRSVADAGNGGRQPRSWPAAARVVALIITTASLALLAAACGGGHVPTTGSGSTSTAGGSAIAQPTSSKLLAYAHCMRAQGVPDFPDPDSSGLIPADRVKALTVSRPVFAAADGRCHSLYPTIPGINAPFSNEQKQDYLNAAACMRTHGIPNFPDPVFSGAQQVQFPIPGGVDANSAQFTQARQICARMIPAGLPYSGNSR